MPTLSSCFLAAAVDMVLNVLHAKDRFKGFHHFNHLRSWDVQGFKSPRYLLTEPKALSSFYNCLPVFPFEPFRAIREALLDNPFYSKSSYRKGRFCKNPKKFGYKSTRFRGIPLLSTDKESLSGSVWNRGSGRLGKWASALT